MGLKSLQVFTLLLVTVLAISKSYGYKVVSSEYTKLYLRRLSQDNYNPRIPPNGNNGPDSAIDVYESMYILDIPKVDDINMEYKANFYFRQTWNDSRLKFDHEVDSQAIVLNDRNAIWTPDLFFVEEREGKVLDVVQPNAFIRIMPNGEVKYSVRVSGLFSCPMDFHKYPHDIQTCSMNIESYGFQKSKIDLKWENLTKAFGVSEVASPHNFNLIGHTLEAKSEMFTFGEYSSLRVNLVFQRETGIFWTRLYIPYLILTILSCLSFWIPLKESCLRLTLLLVILYLMNSISSKMNKMVPTVSYTKGSDVWIAFGESFVFAALLECILASLIARKNTVGDANSSILEPNEKVSSVDSYPTKSLDKLVGIFSSLKGKQYSQAERIDALFRLLFPVMYMIFNIVYWSVYKFDM